MKHKIDDPFDDHDHFEMIAPGTHSNGNGGMGCSGNGAHASTGMTTNVCRSSGTTDCQGNYLDADVCDLNLDGRVCGGGGLSSGGGCISKSNSARTQKELNENTISRLQAMVMSDDEDYDESLTCNVCDRAFHCHRQLASHQQKKRHFGCGGCDSLFPSLMLLEHHKEEFEHWSDDEISRRICCRRNRGDDYFTDTDSFTSEAESEDLERLL